MAESGPMSHPQHDAPPLQMRFFAAGMRVLARDGYAGFKQAAVCAETGLTTGAFYHSFRNWKAFEAGLIEHWRAEATDTPVAELDAAPSPAQRIDALIHVALTLPHRSEAAIRIWAAGDAQVHAALARVDAVRREAVARYTREIGVPADHATRLAATAMLLLIGHEMSDGRLDDLEWSMRHLLETDPHIRAALATD